MRLALNRELLHTRCKDPYRQSVEPHIHRVAVFLAMPIGLLRP